ncbi:MAG: aminotransferase class i and ii [Frankiales bacterium]|nr:aminotransferase class i and ii [Frankiales bacterium]
MVQAGRVLRTVVATRYVTPLREGGSLPGLMEADDLGTYVVKFVGAGQGRKVLVAEVVAGELARRLGLRVPELVLVELDPAAAPFEPDEEVQDLLKASAGLNLGLDFLPGSVTHDAVGAPVDPALAARVLWFDALIGNVDRSWRNPNLLVWHGDLWLIDHGASLIFHHSWGRPSAADRPYDASDHVLRAAAGPSADAELAPRVTRPLLEEVLALVPDVWLADEPGFDSADAVRSAYVEQLLRRVAASGSWAP